MEGIRFVVCLCMASVCGLAHGGNYGYRPHPHPLRHLTNTVVRQSGGARVRLKDAAPQLPAKYDLRNVDGTNYLTSIKDQGDYGTCWAFSTMGVLEGVVRKNEGIDVDFSENNLLNINGYDWGYDGGGNDFMALAVILREECPVMEALDPYSSIGTSVRERSVRVPRKVVFVPERTSVTDAAQMQADIDIIKCAVMKYGPITTSYYHDGGYCNGSAYYYSGLSREPNHAVSIVGWDDEYSATNFRQDRKPPGDGAFIIRNSGGTGMFDRGYMYASYYDETLGFAGHTAYVSVTNGTDYGHVYQHDPYGYVEAGGFDSYTAYAANVFTARTNETLAAFGFYALQQNTSYAAWIVRNPSFTGIANTWRWRKVKEGVCADAGYEVIPFDDEVQVSNGERFAIVVRITTLGFETPLAITCNEYGYLSKVVASYGLSFATDDISDWIDISGDGVYFCCKVYGKAQNAETSTTSTDSPVPYNWLDSYVAQKGTDYFMSYYLGCYNALAEHVATNGFQIAESFAKGLDPDNAAETNLTASISFDAAGNVDIGITPKNTALWDYTVLGSENLRDWHERTTADQFFKVLVQPK